MRIRHPLTASIVAIALAACSSEAPAPEQTETVANEPATDAAMTPAASQAAAPNAQGFVDMAAASDMFEIESSRLAATMAKDPKVKEFAQMMIDEHTKSSTELKTIAGAASPALNVAPKLTAAQQADLDALKAAGTGFDQMYMQKQVAAHEAALAMLQGYASGGDHEALKGFASKMVPAVSGHLSHARGLKPA